MAALASQQLEQAALQALADSRFDDLERLAAGLAALHRPPAGANTNMAPLVRSSRPNPRVLRQIAAQLGAQEPPSGNGNGNGKLQTKSRATAEAFVLSGSSDPAPGKQAVDGAIRCGNLLFIGGIGGWYKEARGNKPARPVAGDIIQQTTDSLTVIKQILEGAGSSLHNLLKVQVVMVDPRTNWGPMTEAYNAFFAAEGVSPMPARNYVGTTSFGSPGNGDGVLVAIDGIAYVG